ncbi:MAG: hypothetical protein ACI4S4_01235 [Candidatus Ornithospirochaeta sp.]
MKKMNMSPLFSTYRETESCPSGGARADFRSGRPEMDDIEMEDFLSSLVYSGLERNSEKDKEILSRIGKRMFLKYAERYTIRKENGELLFVPGTTSERIVNDVEFDERMRECFSRSILFFRTILEGRIGPAINFWAEDNNWSGIISENGADYMNPQSLPALSLENIWRDYDMVLPRGIADVIASMYFMDAFHFSQWLGAVSYVSSIVGEKRKLVDHVFLDAVEWPFSIKEKPLLWNDESAMAGNIAIALDTLNKKAEAHYDGCLLEELENLLKEYGIVPSRIGFPTLAFCPK